MANSEPDVLVAGAGPVGLFAALCLERHGLSLRLVEEEWRATGRSYALALHPETLRRLDEAGHADVLVDAGLRVDVLADYEGATRRRERRVEAAGSRFPFLLVLPQGDLERRLAAALAGRGVDVEWNHRLAAFTDGPERVAAEVHALEKVSAGYAVAATEWAVRSVAAVRPRVVVGADGHRSTVRSHLQVDWDVTGPSDLYAVFEFEAGGHGARHEARFTTDELGTSVLWPLPGNRWRWSVPLADERVLRWRVKTRLGAGPADAEDLEVLARFLETRLPWFREAPTQLHWMTVARFERRVASAFGRGRVWLAGDAAHVGGPLAMRSMNAGFAEAQTLADCVAAVVHGRAPLAMLEEYGRAARATWTAVADQPLLPGADGAPQPQAIR